MEEIKPDLEGATATKRWKASSDIEDLALMAMDGILPTDKRASEARIEEFYMKAYNLYKSGRYKEALPYFKILTATNPKDPRYPMAIGASLHMLKDYRSATSFYMVASLLDPDNPLPQYHMADCYIRIQEPVGAYVALKMALTACQKSPNRYKALVDRINVMINSLKKEFDEKKAKGISKFRGPPNEEKPSNEELQKKLGYKLWGL